MVPDSIKRDVLIEAPAERVWAALTQAEHLGRWFGDAGAEVELEVGGALVCRWREHGTALGVVERVEPHRVFAFRWSLVSGEPPRPGNETLVTFTLVPEGASATRLRVVETGFRSLEGTEEERRRHVDANTSGWKGELAELQGYLTPQPA